MIRFVTTILTVIASAALGFYAAERTRHTAPPVEQVIRASPGLRIEQVRELASLITLHVPISDIHVTQLEGFTGSVKLVLAVHGDVDIATDLSKARFEDMDPEHKTAILVLPPPAPVRPRLDHERTRILDIHRSGMWKVIPGQAGEDKLTNQAMRDAQRILATAAQNDALITKGCHHTQQVIDNFFGALGWQIQIQWDDTDEAPDSIEPNQTPPQVNPQPSPKTNSEINADTNIKAKYFVNPAVNPYRWRRLI